MRRQGGSASRGAMFLLSVDQWLWCYEWAFSHNLGGYFTYGKTELGKRERVIDKVKLYNYPGRHWCQVNTKSDWFAQGWRSGFTQISSKGIVNCECGEAGRIPECAGEDLVISVSARTHVNQEFDAAAKKWNLIGLESILSREQEVSGLSMDHHTWCDALVSSLVWQYQCNHAEILFSFT